MKTSEKAELTTWILHITKFSKSAIPIYDSKALSNTDRKTAITGRTKAIAKHYVFHTNTINSEEHTFLM